MTRRVVITLVILGVLALGGGGVIAGALLFGGGDAPSATPAGSVSSPSPTPSPVKSTPETTASTPAAPATTPTYTQPGTMPTRESTPPPVASTNREVFSWLTSPIPSTWVGQGGDGDNHTYADKSSCTVAAKNCPQIRFFSLVSGPHRVNYGPDPIRQWTKDVCPSRPDGATAQGSFTVDGVSITEYKLNCQGVGNFAWLAPGKLLVIASDEGGVTVDTVTVKSVLERSHIS
jgi:hypothetical protein